MKSVVLVNLVATCVMVGIIWVMQVVHYPLFNMVGKAEFPAYELAHINRITAIVLPFMLVEAFSALFLALNPPEGIHPIIVWAGLGLVVFIWLITLFFLDSQHGSLAGGFNDQIHQALLNSNWLRTIAWSIRGILMCGITYRLMM